jgi:hypothetical protein
MKIHHQYDGVYYVHCPDRGNMTGRAYVKRQMKTVAPGWPMSHIKITSHPYWADCFGVAFNKKSIEHELIFKMAFV